MPTDGPATPADLERFRPYLRLIARQMDRTPAAVAGQIKQGLEQVRASLAVPDPSNVGDPK